MYRVDILASSDFGLKQGDVAICEAIKRHAFLWFMTLELRRLGIINGTAYSTQALFKTRPTFSSVYLSIFRGMNLIG